MDSIEEKLRRDLALRGAARHRRPQASSAGARRRTPPSAAPRGMPANRRGAPGNFDGEALPTQRGSRKSRRRLRSGARATKSGDHKNDGGQLWCAPGARDRSWTGQPPISARSQVGDRAPTPFRRPNLADIMQMVPPFGHVGCRRAVPRPSKLASLGKPQHRRHRPRLSQRRAPASTPLTTPSFRWSPRGSCRHWVRRRQVSPGPLR
jgi:hypothetical protein